MPDPRTTTILPDKTLHEACTARVLDHCEQAYSLLKDAGDTTEPQDARDVLRTLRLAEAELIHATRACRIAIVQMYDTVVAGLQSELGNT